MVRIAHEFPNYFLCNESIAVLEEALEELKLHTFTISLVMLFLVLFPFAIHHWSLPDLATKITMMIRNVVAQCYDKNSHCPLPLEPCNVSKY